MSRSFSFNASGVEIRIVVIRARLPELAEVAAPLIGGILAPEQLAREFVVEADHVRLR